MKIAISKIPFSRYGSYFVISYFEGELLLRDVHGGDESPSELFRLSFNEEVAFECNETKFTVFSKNNAENKIEFIYPTDKTVHIRTTRMALKLEAIKVRYDSFNQMGSNSYEYISYKKETKYHLEVLSGNLSVDAPWKTVGNEHIRLELANDSELYLTNYRVIHESVTPQSFEDAHVAVQKEYQEWLNNMPTTDPQYQLPHDLASYLLWTNTVRVDGFLNLPITYMSKNWMQNIWSWDNCFNAILMAENYPELAYNQLKIFNNYQDDSGAYPDFINDKYVSYNCVKPPIHAWAYQKMMEVNPKFSEDKFLSEMYDSFSRNTNFWLNHRTHDGLPYYTHGNDSGWDNASIFHEGFPVTAPDLTAYLIRQMDILGDFADKLGKQKEAHDWREKADLLYDKFLPAFFDGKQLRAFHTFSGEKIKSTTSAILFLPIVLAYRFNDADKEQLISELLNRFECKYGIATEEPTSSLFTGDGYWLGPVWAPETYIFVDALYEAGYHDDALRIAKKFCDATLVGGLAENFNAHTGEGNDDLAFSWTSSVFLLLNQMNLEED
ncbi:amylo-alpha-1,6-glucosidase [Jeotgalibaca sp. A122]|uniref:amylo-alpha-1,6-glucosidase n=1 Tax=Jeotgalibaca sp. A122 TaxID=3457322 RepID=UPI003FD44B67